MKFLSANSNLGESLGELIGNLIAASDKKLQAQIDDLYSEIFVLRLFSGFLFLLVIVLFVLLYIINRQQK